MFRGSAEQYGGYLSACVRSRQSLGPSLTQLLLYSHSNLKYFAIAHRCTAHSNNRPLALIGSHILRCFPGGVSLHTTGKGRGSSFPPKVFAYIGSPRWAMVRWFRPPGDRWATHSRPRRDPVLTCWANLRPRGGPGGGRSAPPNTVCARPLSGTRQINVLKPP